MSHSARTTSQTRDDEIVQAIRRLASEIQLLSVTVEGVKDDYILQMKRTAQLQVELDTLKKAVGDRNRDDGQRASRAGANNSHW